jgi:hypothetical protein
MYIALSVKREHRVYPQAKQYQAQITNTKKKEKTGIKNHGKGDNKLKINDILHASLRANIY